MALVKLKYTRSRGAIKAHLRYVVHRPGKERDKLTRELFHHNYLSVSKQYAYDLINASPRGTVFYKMTINFHPLKEDTRKDLDLQHITSLTVREMQQRIGRTVPFIATIHDGHVNTDLRHIHAICLVQGRLSKEEFARLKTLWQTATAEVRSQRRNRDRFLERRRSRFLTKARVLYHYGPSQQRYRKTRGLQMQPGCYQCGYGQSSGIPVWREFCPHCRSPLKQEKTLRLELDRQL
jgi:RNase P subunit RPR2